MVRLQSKCVRRGEDGKVEDEVERWDEMAK
jgi:hypothetical protein